MKIILDSNVLISAFNSKDSRHDLAIKLLNGIVDEEIWINQFILVEFSTVLLLRTKDLKLSEEVTRSLRSIDNVMESHFNGEEFGKILSFFYQQSSAKLSVPDCSLLYQAKKNRSGVLATFDKDLRQAAGKIGIKILPKRMWVLLLQS